MRLISSWPFQEVPFTIGQRDFPGVPGKILSGVLLKGAGQKASALFSERPVDWQDLSLAIRPGTPAGRIMKRLRRLAANYESVSTWEISHVESSHYTADIAPNGRESATLWQYPARVYSLRRADSGMESAVKIMTVELPKQVLSWVDGVHLVGPRLSAQIGKQEKYSGFKGTVQGPFGHVKGHFIVADMPAGLDAVLFEAKDEIVSTDGLVRIGNLQSIRPKPPRKVAALDLQTLANAGSRFQEAAMTWTKRVLDSLDVEEAVQALIEGEDEVTEDSLVLLQALSLEQASGGLLNWRAYPGLVKRIIRLLLNEDKLLVPGHLQAVGYLIPDPAIFTKMGLRLAASAMPEGSVSGQLVCGAVPLDGQLGVLTRNPNTSAAGFTTLRVYSHPVSGKSSQWIIVSPDVKVNLGDRFLEGADYDDFSRLWIGEAAELLAESTEKARQIPDPEIDFRLPEPKNRLRHPETFREITLSALRMAVEAPITLGAAVNAAWTAVSNYDRGVMPADPAIFAVVRQAEKVVDGYAKGDPVDLDKLFAVVDQYWSTVQEIPQYLLDRIPGYVLQERGREIAAVTTPMDSLLSNWREAISRLEEEISRETSRWSPVLGLPEGDRKSYNKARQIWRAATSEYQKLVETMNQGPKGFRTRKGLRKKLAEDSKELFGRAAEQVAELGLPALLEWHLAFQKGWATDSLLWQPATGKMFISFLWDWFTRPTTHEPERRIQPAPAADQKQESPAPAPVQEMLEPKQLKKLKKAELLELVSKLLKVEEAEEPPKPKKSRKAAKAEEPKEVAPQASQTIVHSVHVVNGMASKPASERQAWQSRLLGKILKTVYTVYEDEPAVALVNDQGQTVGWIAKTHLPVVLRVRPSAMKIVGAAGPATLVGGFREKTK